MNRFFSFFCCLLLAFNARAQTPKTYTSSEILLQLKKLNVLGSVLYIAAHPDDENTRLLAYLANEKLYRTGYLSLTRGDGGQNLIGDEQGIDLGLIRTQELLAARRIDGAEQFFSRAYDFGFCKSAEEALATWGHDKILSDAVWVIRKFKPDVIIARFPEDSRAGHGHHAASGIIAREAFDAAADPGKFPEQLKQGVTVWQAKRMLWNTFNFGGNSTQNESQFKVEVGMYNTLLGKSYGEIAALSRSQHKSQGFGVPAQRGSVIEYFETIRGDKPTTDLLQGVAVGWGRIGQPAIEDSVNHIIETYDVQHPEKALDNLIRVYKMMKQLEDGYWKQQKLKELQLLIENASGLFLEATSASQFAVQGDSLKFTFTANNRLGVNALVSGINAFSNAVKMDSLKLNTTVSKTIPLLINAGEKITQPYWLEKAMDKGSFNVTDQQLIGKAENDPLSVEFKVEIEGEAFIFVKPVRYKFTDPVKGEIYQPVFIVPQIALHITPELSIFRPGNRSNPIIKNYHLFTHGNRLDTGINDLAELSRLARGTKTSISSPFDIAGVKNESRHGIIELEETDGKGRAYQDIREIDYDHIPSIKYFKAAKKRVLFVNASIAGRSVGYISGAGDKVPQALEQMGYKVTLLKAKDITLQGLKKFDAVITGVRAYNTNEWMGDVYDALMKYVQAGGVLVTQYNTNNFISNIKGRIGPYPFGISRNRVTDENAKVNFLLPGHPVLNYPNKISEKDFEGWIQERSIYHAEKIDSNYQRVISLKDSGEKEDDGSLIVANYGKGKFVYTGLVFFRELPAGVAGAYRLFANIIAAPPAPGSSSSKKSTAKRPAPPKSMLAGKTSAQ